MQNKLDNIIQELKELSGNSRLNIELPDDIFISAYERNEPYRVCRRVNILRDYPDDKIKIYP
uniref:hypothetical protein n=1 Tax=Acinetobacter sp. TaxID=472 RepID=UPI001E43AA62|nr:hypothetical protein [Acinetobacter sp.]